MVILLADDKIQSLIDEEKRVSLKLSDFIPFKNKKGHKEQEISIKRNDDSEFKIIIRQNKSDPLNFSVILGYIPNADKPQISKNKLQNYK